MTSLDEFWQVLNRIQVHSLFHTLLQPLFCTLLHTLFCTLFYACVHVMHHQVTSGDEFRERQAQRHADRQALNAYVLDPAVTGEEKQNAR